MYITGISDGMEVATKVTDEATILEIKVREDRITFSIKLDNVGRAMKGKKPAKKNCCNFRDFGFANFLISVVVVVESSSLVA